MEDQAISDGFSNLKNGKEYDDFYQAALCRESADWIVGMNVTTLFSTLYGQALNVGRVMTPTLAMLVQREAEIEEFKPEPIYRLSISCGGITAVSDRFDSKQDAEKILIRLKEEKTAQVTKIDPADKQEKVPQLYSLTALQRDANRYLGFIAQQTLDYTQSLYEKKLVTYPRIDSRQQISDRGYGRNDSEPCTENGKYISSYQCNPELVDLKFAQAKKEYLHKTWRQSKGDVLTYQIR